MLRLPPERNQWFRDLDGVWARQKLEDEILTEEVVLSAEDLAGEAFVTATWDDVSGPTITGTAVNGDTTGATFTVTGSGDATLVLTTVYPWLGTAARTLRKRLRWIATDASLIHDYR
jgi:hypothetical protein